MYDTPELNRGVISAIGNFLGLYPSATTEQQPMYDILSAAEVNKLLASKHSCREFASGVITVFKTRMDYAIQNDGRGLPLYDGVLGRFIGPDQIRGDLEARASVPELPQKRNIGMVAAPAH